MQCHTVETHPSRGKPRILDRVTGDDTKLRTLIEEEALNAHVARLIYEARTGEQAGIRCARIRADSSPRNDLMCLRETDQQRTRLVGPS